MAGLEEKIRIFLAHGFGSGDGVGRGDGSGDSYGRGDGTGNGYGDGNGNGYGDGNGFGNGDGYIRKVGDTSIYYVDGEPTAIYSVHGNFAKGGILKQDFTFAPCYIAKVDDSFAHGETLESAFADAQKKAYDNMPIERRIEAFNARFPDRNIKIPAKELFDWHHILTGSCLMGRKEWCNAQGINVETDTFTVNEFIELTKESYGGDIIKKLSTSV